MSPNATVEIHQAQADFLDSSELFRGFTGGRGAGKTFVGAYDMLRRAKPNRLYLCAAPTYTMLKDACWRTFAEMADKLHFSKAVNRSDLRVTLGNGAEVLFRSADEPDRLRGPNLSGAWLDEASVMERGAYDITIACLREAGEQGWLSATFTPKGINHWTYDVFGKGGPNVALFHARTLDNPFLPDEFYGAIRGQYTNYMALQELEGRFIEDNPDALWKRALIEETRALKAPELKRVVVAIDPAATSGEEANDTGIIVAGRGVDDHGYILADTSVHLSPNGWGSAAIVAYHKFHADRIVAEVNHGGEMVEHVIKTIDPGVAYKAVHASRGKQLRAEPVAALYEQRKVHHAGTFGELENQLCQWVPGDDSPDRLDALVWAMTELMLEPTPGKAKVTTVNIW